MGLVVADDVQCESDAHPLLNGHDIPHRDAGVPVSRYDVQDSGIVDRQEPHRPVGAGLLRTANQLDVGVGNDSVLLFLRQGSHHVNSDNPFGQHRPAGRVGVLGQHLDGVLHDTARRGCAVHRQIVRQDVLAVVVGLLDLTPTMLWKSQKLP